MYLSKEDFFNAKTEEIVGDSLNQSRILKRQLDSGIMYRRIFIDSLKGGKEIDIAQITDTHLNHVNLKDFEEKNPSILSTLEYRRGFRGMSTFDNLEKVMEILPLFDKTVVTGDVVDYLTWGALEFTERFIYEKCPEALLAVGGHDITRVMQGKVKDPSSLESRYEILRTIWRNDVYYYSEVMEEKVMLIILNNGEGKYYDFQTESLKKDIQKAREEKLIILLFQHEPLCTHNPNEKNVKPLWAGDPASSGNFCDNYLGKENDESETTKLYRLITENADLIKGVFCGHAHNEFYTEIIASYMEGGKKVETVIPQHVLHGVPYEEGHLLVITVK